MKENSVSVLEDPAMVQDQSIFHVTNTPLVIFVSPAVIAFHEKVINLLLATVALITDLNANHTYV